MNAFLVCLLLNTCNVDVVNIEPGRFAYRNLDDDSKPRECLIDTKRRIRCREIGWNEYRAKAQFFGKQQPK